MVRTGGAAVTLVAVVLAQVALFAGGPVTVQCPTDIGGDRVGEALIAQRIVRINASECVDVNHFARKPLLPRRELTTWGAGAGKGATDYAAALFVLAHEAEHVGRQDVNEARTTCRGLADVPVFARALGANWLAANRMWRLARLWVRENMPAEYQSRCTSAHPFTVGTPPGVTRRPGR